MRVRIPPPALRLRERFRVTCGSISGESSVSASGWAAERFYPHMCHLLMPLSSKRQRPIIRLSGYPGDLDSSRGGIEPIEQGIRTSILAS